MDRHGATTLLPRLGPSAATFRAAVAWTLAATLLPTAASARPGGGGRAFNAGSQGANLSFPRASGVVRGGVPVVTRPLSPELGALARQSRLERLANASGKLFDIVPPVPPDLAADGPLPGYRLVRLGRKHNNRLCFAATVAGTKGLIMLDTGAANTALNEATYRSLRLGGSARLPAGVPRVLSINGQNTPLAEAPDLRVGGSNLGAVPVCLIPRGYLYDGGTGEGGGQLYDGLLGQNVLRHYHAMIDCGRLVLYLDLDPSKKLDLSASFARYGWTRVPMTDTGSHFLVPCVVNGRRFRLVVDTGAPFTNLDLSLVRDARVATRALPWRQNLIGRESQPVSLVDLDRLQIGGYLARDVHMTATAQSLAAFAGRGGGAGGDPIIGLLGGDLLARHGAIIDFGNKALYLKPAGGPASAGHRAGR